MNANGDSKDCTGFRALTPSPPDTKLIKSSKITTCCATRINFTVCYWEPQTLDELLHWQKSLA